MKIRFLLSVSDVSRSYESDEVCEVPDERAEQFIKQGIAEPANKSDRETKAADGGLEAAALAPPKRRG